MAAEAYDELLRLLAADREQAAEAYNQLRVKLIRFFESQGCRFAEDCADETFQRVARKLAEGVQIKTDNPYVYFRGVARNVMLERWREQERVVAVLDDLSPGQHPAMNPAEIEQRERERLKRESLADHVERCLEELPPESRSLLLEYYKDFRRAKIDNRSLMAERLGISVTALRNRVNRLRKKIEGCVTDRDRL